MIEVGASRLVLAAGVHRPGAGPRSGHVVLGVGPDGPVGVTAASGPVVPVTIDLATTGRILLTGPAANGLLRAIVVQAPDRVSVRRGVADLARLPWSPRVPVAVDPDPDAGWPVGELPRDAVVVSVGSSWDATLLTPAPDGSAVVRRFHAAGRPVGAASGSDGSFVAEEVPRPRAELTGDVVRVPQPARGQGQAPTADALVELVPHPGQEGDLLVEPRPP